MDSGAVFPELSIPSRAALRRAPVRAARVWLAPVEPADGPELWQAVESSRAHLGAWLPWVPYNVSVETSQRYAEACAVDWDDSRALRLAIRAKEHQQLLGVVSLDNCVHSHGSCDLGYWLRVSAIGRGFMTEAVAAVVDFAFRSVGLHRIRCAVALGNKKSLQVMARLGFQREGVARHAEYLNGNWVDHAVFARLCDDAPPYLGR